MTTMRFFAIGSWSEGMFHFEKLKSLIISSEPASIKAKVYRLPVGFPVLTESSSETFCDEVLGQIIEVKYDETLLALMDSLFGVNAVNPQVGLFLRQTKVVSKVSGGVESCEVYFINPIKISPKAVEIKGGLWQDNLKTEPPLPRQLNDRQKSYVLKLGAAKGRDIVPINDLTLYRELMKLELIVDKGRRLALSSLGKEVYNHLS